MICEVPNNGELRAWATRASSLDEASENISNTTGGSTGGGEEFGSIQAAQEA